jgi:serine acetyltransferase
VVVKDIPARVVAGGNPCRIIKHLSWPIEMKKEFRSQKLQEFRIASPEGDFYPCTHEWN